MDLWGEIRFDGSDRAGHGGLYAGDGTALAPRRDRLETVAGACLAGRVLRGLDHPQIASQGNLLCAETPYNESNGTFETLKRFFATCFIIGN